MFFSTTSRDVMRYFKNLYPDQGNVMYGHAINNIAEKVEKKRLTLSGISTCIAEDPEILRYIFCKDKICGKLLSNSGDKHFEFEWEDVYICPAIMRHDWFTHMLTKARSRIRSKVPPRVYPVSLETVRDKLCSHYGVDSLVVSVDKVKMLWSRVRNNDSNDPFSFDELIIYLDGITRRWTRPHEIITVRGITQERLRQLLNKINRIKREYGSWEEYQKKIAIPIDKPSDLSPTSFTEEDMADKYINRERDAVLKMIGSEWNSDKVKYFLYDMLSARVVGILVRETKDSFRAFWDAPIDDLGNLRGMGRHSLLQIMVIRIIYDRLLKQYGTHRDNNPSE